MHEDIQDLAALVRAEVARQQAHQLLVVESVREDGTVNLQWGTDIIEAVPCNQSYTDRKDGDVVLVLRHDAGWRVMDKIGAPVSPPEPDMIDLTFGPPAPDASFVPAGSVWVKEGAIYIQTGEGPGGPGEGPPSSSTPKPVRFQPTARAGYRSGSRDGSSVRQGAWPSYPKAWTGAWFYGTQIQDACAGKTVDTMEVWVSRTSARHGASGKVPPKLGTHAHSTAPSLTPALSNRWDGPGLGLGQAAWITVPTRAADALADGSARGIGVGTGVGSNYLVAADNSGTIRISFR